MVAIYTYTCKKTGLHVINGNINFDYASGGLRAYNISTGGATETITAQVDYVPEYGTYIPVSFTAYMQKNAKIVFYARQNSGKTTNVQVLVSISY